MAREVVHMNCQFARKIFQSSDTGFTVAIYKTKSPLPTYIQAEKQDGFFLFKACGSNLPLETGSNSTLSGCWVAGKHGYQLDVFASLLYLPKNGDEVTAYLSSGLFSGIGPATAKRIVERFGENTLHILENEPLRLTEVSGVSEQTAVLAQKTYVETVHSSAAIGYLKPYGISVKQVMKLQNHFGPEVLKIIKENPYRICEVPGFAFLTANAIAGKLQLKDNDIRRIDAALFCNLKDFEGHAYLTVSQFIGKVKGFLTPCSTEPVSEKVIAGRLYAMWVAGLVQLEENRIYPRELLEAENTVARRVSELLKQHASAPEHLNQMISDTAKEKGFLLAEMQRQAVLMFFKHQISILTGPPGSGKSAILDIIMEIWEKTTGGTLLLAAPTAVASQRMGVKATTLHKLLNITAEYEEKSKEPLTADAIIIDEFSMAELRLVSLLLKKLPPNCKLYLIGDANQLPSVGAGQVLRDFIHCGKIPVTHLTEVFRQRATSRIYLNAQLISKNQSQLLYGTDFIFQEATQPEQCAEQLIVRYLELVGEKGTDMVQILSPMRENERIGTTALNRRIQDALFPEGGITVGCTRFCVGDKIMQTKTDDRNSIPNGMSGRIIQIDESGDDPLFYLSFSDGKSVVYSEEQMETVELSYATTIHKSQGNEYPHVLIPVLSISKRLLTRNLIYTGLTRAKETLELFGQKQALFMAIHNTKGDIRSSYLSEKIIINCKEMENYNE